MFLDLVMGSKADAFQPTDLPLLVRYCEAARWRSAPRARLRASRWSRASRIRGSAILAQSIKTVQHDGDALASIAAGASAEQSDATDAAAVVLRAAGFGAAIVAGRGYAAMTLTPIDLDALRRAMAEARRDPQEAAHLARLLKDHDNPAEDRPWIDVAKSAAYHCQVENLKLRPWELPPMHGAVDNPRGNAQGREKARKLLDRLLAAGLSRFEPNPEVALAAIEQSHAT